MRFGNLGQIFRTLFGDEFFCGSIHGGGSPFWEGHSVFLFQATQAGYELISRKYGGGCYGEVLFSAVLLNQLNAAAQGH
jgi:hypothetical protein